MDENTSVGLFETDLGEGYSISTALRSQTSNAYARKTIGRVTHGASTGTEHK
jgi:hypothetical protein